MSRSTPGFELYYWKLRNRGNFFRLQLVVTKTPYTEINDEVTNVIELFDNSNGSFGNTPCFAPPCIKRGNFVYSQTGAAVGWLASQLGLLPKSNDDQFRALNVLANINDIIGEVAGTAKQKHTMESLQSFYSYNKEKDTGSSARRLDKLIFCVAKPLDSHKNLWYFDNKMTYTDLCIFNLLDMLLEWFGQTYFKAFIIDRYPRLYAIYENVYKIGSVKKLVQDQIKNKIPSWPTDKKWLDVPRKMGWKDSPLLTFAPPTFELFYWKMRNRGNFLRLQLLATDTKFTEINDDVVKHIELFDQSNGSFGNTPCFAPPCIKLGNSVYNQTGAAVGWLASKVGLLPKSSDDQFRALNILANINDVIGEVASTVKSKHNKEYLDSFYGYNKEKFTGSSARRLDKLMFCIAKPLDNHKNLYYFDNKMTYIDLCIFNLLDGLLELFGQTYFKEYVVDRYPRLNAIYEDINKIEAINKLVKSQIEKNMPWWPVKKEWQALPRTMEWKDSLLLKYSKN